MKVLVALDNSPISLRAAREAVRLFGGAEFFVISVTQIAVPWVAAYEFGAVYPADLLDLPAEHAEQLADSAKQAGIEEAEVLTITGDAAHAICQAAENYDVDVVVVGSHDKGVLRRLVDPSVAQAVVQGTYRPVLVVSGSPPND